MKSAKWTLATATLLGAALASEAALAHRGRPRLSIGFHIGAPLLWHPWHYYGHPAYYYPAPVYVAPAPPPAHVERRADSPVTDQYGWWYYCSSARGYYPHVKECPGGWEKVPPAPQ